MDSDLRVWRIKKEYENISKLIKNNLNIPETSEAQKLFEELKNVKNNGFFIKKEFYDVVMWKNPRPKKYYLSNSEKNIIKISKKVLSTKSEKEKIKLLISLKGVSIAVASSLLTIISPEDYGIIDIKLWQLLSLYCKVKPKPPRKVFNFNDWELYLSILRRYANKFQLNVRDIERILFFYYKKIQVGTFYRTKNSSH